MQNLGMAGLERVVNDDPLTDSRAVMSQNEIMLENDMAAKFTSNVDKGGQLTVRIASEEFDGPVKYKVSAFSEEGGIWNSGEQLLIGGHDTKRMGRVNRKQLPWQIVSFPVKLSEEKVSAIEVEILIQTERRMGRLELCM